MRLTSLCLSISLVAAAVSGALLRAQTTPAATDINQPAPPQTSALPPEVNPNGHTYLAHGPFSRLAVGVGVSAMGVNMQAATNVSRHLNVRAVGNYFNYSRSNMTFNGFTANGTASFATAGAALDFFPWANHGFRISPGVLLYNRNQVTGAMVAKGGASFTLNNATYYSSPRDPLTGTGEVSLHAQNPAPSLTLGWGNLIPRNGGHWSFPVEVGAAYTGDPAPNIAFTGGQVCSNAQGTAGCQNVQGDATLNANLQSQIAKYRRDLQPLRFYPMVSFGVGFSFPIR